MFTHTAEGLVSIAPIKVTELLQNGVPHRDLETQDPCHGRPGLWPCHQHSHGYRPPTWILICEHSHRHCPSPQAGREGDTYVQRKPPTQSHLPRVTVSMSPTPPSITHTLTHPQNSGLLVCKSGVLCSRPQHLSAVETGAPVCGWLSSSTLQHHPAPHRTASASMRRPEFTFLLSLGKLFDLPEPQFFHLLNGTSGLAYLLYQDAMN